MRIGEVSRQYHISVDNLYYYINYGLLVPPKPRGQYIFNKTVLQDLEWILELKELDFTLREIHMLLSLKRISGLADSQDIEELKAVYEGKQEFCLQEINRKQEIIQQLDKKIAALKENQSDKIPQTGVPVSALPLLCCPVCGSPLSLKDVEMNSRFLYSGTLSCSCGYQAQIQNGILMTPNKNTSLHDTPDITRELYKDLPPELITMFERSYQQMLKQMEETNLRGKVIAETYINAWFFMHNHLAALPEDSLYLMIDKYPETLLM